MLDVPLWLSLWQHTAVLQVQILPCSPFQMKIPTYSARYFAPGSPMAGEIIYENQPPGNLYGQLPEGAYPVEPPSGVYRRNTLQRIEGGDPWEYNVFRTPSGRLLELFRTEEPLEMKIVIVVDADNTEVKVLSNVRDLSVTMLNASDPDPESTDAAEAKIFEQDLHEIDSINF